MFPTIISSLSIRKYFKGKLTLQLLNALMNTSLLFCTFSITTGSSGILDYVQIINVYSFKNAIVNEYKCRLGTAPFNDERFYEIGSGIRQ